MKKTGVILAVFMLMLGLLPLGVSADNTPGSGPANVDPYSLPDGTVFTLTYPDGSVVTTDDPAEADRLLQEYKLLYEAETNRNGEIHVKDLIRAGELRIEEIEAPDGYIRDDTVYDVPVNDEEITIENTKRPRIDISVGKVWNDDNDRDGYRPESITVNLFADGEKIDSRVVDGTGGDNWNVTFKNLPKEHEDGTDIRYTVKESRVKKYTTLISGTMQDGFVITNTHTPETTEVQVQKLWEDNNDEEKLRPKTVTLTLFADGKSVKTLDLSAGEDGSWTGSFTGLPKYRDEGTPIRYTVKETVVPDGYEVESISNRDDVIIIVNRHDIPKDDTTPVKRINGRRGTVKLAERDRDITFTITEYVPENAETVSFTDKLEDVLVIKEAFLDADRTPLNSFKVGIEGQTVTAALKGDDAAKVRGQKVTLTIVCNISPSVTDEQLIKKYGDEKRIPNTAEVSIDGKPKATNTVKVIPPTPGKPKPTVTPRPTVTPTPGTGRSGGGGSGAAGTSGGSAVRTGDQYVVLPWVITGTAAAVCLIFLLIWRRWVNKGRKN